jgi:cobalamin transport system substrate-binding protein
MRPLPLRPAGFGTRAARTIATGATVLALAACSPGATARPSVPPDATGALIPPATATVPPSGAAAASPSPAFPVTLSGDDGTAVRLAAEPKKIVSLTPAETEILYAIGAGDRVVGKVQDIADYPPEARNVPVVSAFGANGVDVDTEKIVSLGTDLVIAGGQGGTPQDAIDKLRSLKIPVLVVYAPNVDGVLHDIDLTGQAVGETGAADGLQATMKGGFEDVAKTTDGVDKPRVFYETGDQPSIFGIADNSVYAQMIGLAGGTPITTGSATSWEMPAEKIIAADPQIIILGDSAYGVTEDSVAARPGWTAITAVKNRAVLGIDDIIVTRPGPRLVDGLRSLLAAIHPELVPRQASPAAGSLAPAPSASTDVYGG